MCSFLLRQPCKDLNALGKKNETWRKRGEQKGMLLCNAPSEIIDNSISQTTNELFVIYGVSLSSVVGVASEVWAGEMN